MQKPKKTPKKQKAIPDGWKIGYKLTYKRGNKLLSAYASGSRAVQYKLNKKAVPKIGAGPLAVFYSLENAENFRFKMTVYSIYQCLYKPSKKRSLWYQYSKYKKTIVPFGTKFADRVILKRKII